MSLSVLAVGVGGSTRNCGVCWDEVEGEAEGVEPGTC
jgi:hypothetical protein